MKRKSSSAMSTKDSHRPSISTVRYVGSPGVPYYYSNSTSFDSPPSVPQEEHSDRLNYALLIILYTLQGIPMGLSASIPFLIQQKMKALATLPTAPPSHHSSSALSYKANAIFALCSWPFSLKLLWAPIVDACFFPKIGRRKTWLVPVQASAALLMISGASFVERQLGLSNSGNRGLSNLNVNGVTAFFFALYALMATQDIAVDGWALTMLSKKNRGRGPVCNSIGQNIGYFLSFVGFLALNDPESSESLWRPLLGLASKPGTGLVSLGGFIRSMGYFMLGTTILVALFKQETPLRRPSSRQERFSPSTLALLESDRLKKGDKDEDHELDASEIGLRETYHRLWEVCKLPAVRWLFLILLTYRLPTALSDNVKFLKAVEYGLSKSTTALLSPTVILPLGIIVPIIASHIWHGHPLRQFMLAYKLRVTLVPLLDLWMLDVLKRKNRGPLIFWTAIIASTALQASCNSLQFNAQMTFFASRVDPAIGGSYMTLLNTAANLGGTWPASLVMELIGLLSSDPVCTTNAAGMESCTEGNDPFVPFQMVLSVLGVVWVLFLGRRVERLSALPDDSWRTHLLDKPEDVDVEAVNDNKWDPKDNKFE